ncbi:MAG: hypothetical protein IKL32_00020 [Alphaproteobacteria bacterium]|nr:hypothetical protein [Alphaproteobacteria bacterium]MBR6674297.1 hypothetical protein [Alphaproteobacteria bacterium]
MSRGARLSLLGLYQYDNSIFDGIMLPDEIDRDTFRDNLLMTAGELEILYPDADFMRQAIMSWSRMRLHTWECVARVLYEDYDPFVNIKRDETRTISEQRDLTGTNKGTTKTNENAWNDSSRNGVQTGVVAVDLTNTDKGWVTTNETFHVEGDSAIRDAQDIVRMETEVRTDFDLYNYIINDFIHRFCLLVY